MARPSEDSDALTKRKADRYRFLRALFDSSKGSTRRIVVMWELGKWLGMSREDTSDVADYLIKEGLVKPIALGGSISLTHEGLREVEESIERPDEATEHFPASVIMNVSQTFNGPVGSVQNAGQGNVANVHQVVGPPPKDFLPLVERLRVEAHKLGDEEATDIAERVHRHATAEEPNLVKIGGYLKALEAYAPLAPHVAAVLDAIVKMGGGA